jgi:hypothetical protein
MEIIIIIIIIIVIIIALLNDSLVCYQYEETQMQTCLKIDS